MQNILQKQILSRGSGRSSSFNLALVGSPSLATRQAERTTFGDRKKRPAMKSSTMKGAKALESKSRVETVPNREQSSLTDTGALLVSTPRNRGVFAAETMPGLTAGTYGDGVEVVPPSNVTLGTDRITNPGRFAASAGGSAVPRWFSEVIQTQWTGRVAQVGAVAFSLLRTPWANALQGSGAVVSVSGPCRTVSGWHRMHKNDERADGY